MRRHLFPLTLFFLISLTLSSCLTIIESYTFKENSTGDFAYTMDMSELAPLMKMGETFNEAEDDDDKMEDTREEFEMYVKSLKKIKGLKKVKFNADEENLIYTIRFRFKNMQALNSGLNEIISPGDDRRDHTFFRYDQGALVHEHKYGDPEALEEFMEEEDENSEMAESILRSMKYKINITFPSAVKDVSTNGVVKIFGDEMNKISIETNFFDLAENQELLDFRVEFEDK